MSYPENTPNDTDDTMEIADPSNPLIHAGEEDEPEQNSASKSKSVKKKTDTRTKRKTNNM